MKAIMHTLATAIGVLLRLFFLLCLLGASFGAGGWPGVLLGVAICGFLGWAYNGPQSPPDSGGCFGRPYPWPRSL
jgi:hypothetical protein